MSKAKHTITFTVPDAWEFFRELKLLRAGAGTLYAILDADTAEANNLANGAGELAGMMNAAVYNDGFTDLVDAAEAAWLRAIDEASPAPMSPKVAAELEAMASAHGKKVRAALEAGIESSIRARPRRAR